MIAPHPTCSVAECDRPAHTGGRCIVCYEAWRQSVRRPCTACGKTRVPATEDGRCRTCDTAARRVCPDCAGRKHKDAVLCRACFARARTVADVPGILRALANGGGISRTARRFGVSPAYVSALRVKHAAELPGLAQRSTRERGGDLTGREYGTLRVDGAASRRSASGHRYWMCECRVTLGGCGRRVEVVGADLTRGQTRSCGCRRGHAAE